MKNNLIQNQLLIEGAMALTVYLHRKKKFFRLVRKVLKIAIRFGRRNYTFFF